MPQGRGTGEKVWKHSREKQIVHARGRHNARACIFINGFIFFKFYYFLNVRILRICLTASFSETESWLAIIRASCPIDDRCPEGPIRSFQTVLSALLDLSVAKYYNLIVFNESPLGSNKIVAAIGFHPLGSIMTNVSRLLTAVTSCSRYRMAIKVCYCLIIGLEIWRISRVNI